MNNDGHKLHTCTDDRCSICVGGLSWCDVCGGAEIDLPRVCPGRRMTEREREAVRAGGPGPAPGTQRDRARAALGGLYRNAISASALAALRDVLDDAQNGPPDGEADGSIDEVLWTGLRKMAEAFAEVQRVHEIMGRPGERASDALSRALFNAIAAGVCAAEENDPQKYQAAKRALLKWCADNGVSDRLRDEALRKFKERVGEVGKSSGGPVTP